MTQHASQDDDSHDEFTRMRSRVHKQADMLQTHEVRLAENSVQIELLQDVMGTFASKEQLSEVKMSMSALVSKEHLTGVMDSTTLQFKHLSEAIDKIQTGINWIVLLVLGSVVLAVLALVFVPKELR